MEYVRKSDVVLTSCMLKYKIYSLHNIEMRLSGIPSVNPIVIMTSYLLLTSQWRIQISDKGLFWDDNRVSNWRTAFPSSKCLGVEVSGRPWRFPVHRKHRKPPGPWTRHCSGLTDIQTRAVRETGVFQKMWTNKCIVCYQMCYVPYSTHLLSWLCKYKYIYIMFFY